jgi:hypothetical protein
LLFFYIHRNAHCVKSLKLYPCINPFSYGQRFNLHWNTWRETRSNMNECKLT